MSNLFEAAGIPLTTTRMATAPAPALVPQVPLRDKAWWDHLDANAPWGEVEVPDNPAAPITPDLLDLGLADFDLSVFRTGTVGRSTGGANQWLIRWAAHKVAASHYAEDVERAKAAGAKLPVRPTREPKLTDLALRVLHSATWGTPVYLEGERGIGKSAAVKDTAERLGLAVIVVHLSQATPESFALSAPEWAEDAEPVISTMVVGGVRRGNYLILEEPNRAPADVVAASMEALSEKSVQGRKMPWLGVAAIMNPAGDYDVTEFEDPAILDRGSRFTVLSKHTGWDDHLIRKYGYDQQSRSRVRSLIQAASRVDPEFQGLLNARKIEQFIQVADYNAAHPGDEIPLDCVLGEDGTGNYVRFAKAEDRVSDKKGTSKQKIDARHHGIVGMLAKAYDTRHVTLADAGKDLARRALLATIRNDWSLLWFAPHGAGKTSIVKDVVRKHAAEFDGEVRVEAISLAQIAPQSQVIPVPIDGDLEFLVDSRWVTGKYVALFDEFNRATPQQLAEVMSVTHQGERTLGGRRLPTVGLVALCNMPSIGEGAERFDYDVNPLDPAMRERFPVTIITDVADHGVDRWLMEQPKYAEIAPAVIGWWTEKVLTQPNGSIMCSGRTVARLMEHIHAGLPLHEALAPIGGGINPVRALLPDLRSRLNNVQTLSAEKLLKDVTWTLSQMTGSQDFQSGVTDVLMTAPIKTLEDNIDALFEILKKLDNSYREAFILMSHDEERQKVFIGLLARIQREAQANGA